MDGRRKTNAFLSSLDEDLLIYEEELKKRGFTSSTTLKYLREHDLEDIGMADGHKRLLMNAVSKLQSPQQAKDCKPLPSKKRRIPFVVIDDSQVGSTSFDRKEYLSDDDTKAKQLSEQKQVSTIAIETPVERFLRHKRNNIAKLQSDLEEKKVNLEEFLSDLHEAQEENTHEQSNSSCGQCHLRLGHTRRNCTLSPCKSVYSCGLIEKHPDAKKNMKALENETAQLQRKIQKLQSEHDSYVKAKTSTDRSKSKVIESRLLAESPTRYIDASGSKNWMLLNKDVAVLEKKLNINESGLPDRKSMMTLLSESTKEYSSTGRPDVSKKSNENPKRPVLENHGIKFPASACSPGPPTSTIKCEMDGKIDDFALAVSLQNEECNEYKDKQIQYEAASSLMEMFNTSNAHSNTN